MRKHDVSMLNADFVAASAPTLSTTIGVVPEPTLTVRPGLRFSDEVADIGWLGQQIVDCCLDLVVGFGDPLVLAEVLGPGVDFPLFGEPIGVGWVAPQGPPVGSGSAACAFQPVHGGDESVHLVGVDSVRDAHHGGSAVGAEQRRRFGPYVADDSERQLGAGIEREQSPYRCAG